MACLTCVFPASTDHGDQGWAYDELVQAAEAGCPRCTFLLKCIRRGAAHIEVGDIKKVTTPSRGYAKIEWSGGEIMLEIFNQHGKSIIFPYLSTSQRYLSFRRRFIMAS